MNAGGNIVGGNMTLNTTTTSTISKTEIAFQPIADAVKESPAAMRPAAEATLASLKKEVEKVLSALAPARIACIEM
ncbi:MAG: hypothetical protein ACJ8AW_11730 [Rhodopila sp.]